MHYTLAAKRLENKHEIAVGRAFYSWAVLMYVQVEKEGTLFTASNYWAWRGTWVPEVAWAVTLGAF